MKIVLFLALCLPIGLGAQTAPAASATKPEAPPTDPKGLCHIEGTVLNGLTGEKLRKVNLTLRAGKNNYAATSDANGAFIFDQVEPGAYRLEADRPGFVHEYYGAKRSGQFGGQLTLARGQKMAALEMKMAPTGSISGKLTDEDGDPIAGGYVQLVRRMFNNGIIAMLPSSMATADDEGVFKIASVQPGKYFLRATPRQNFNGNTAKLAGVKTEQDYVSTYFPGSMDLSAAAPVQITPGQNASGISIQLRKTNVYRIKGKIAGDVQNGTANVAVQAYPVESIPSRGVMSRSGLRSPDGTFEITGLVPGRYVLVLASYGGQMKTLARQTVTVGNEDLENVSLAPFNLPVTLKGTVRVEGEKPTPPPSAPGTPAVPDQPLKFSGIRLNVISSEDPYAMGTGTCKDDGTFVVPDLPPNRYTVSAYGFPAGTYLKSITAGERDITFSTLDLDQASGDMPVEITLGYGTAQLDVAVQDEKGQPTERTFVLLTTDPVTSEMSRIRNNGGNTDKDGKVTVKNIAPGNYKIFAFEDFISPDDMDPEFLKKVDTKGTKIQIEPNGKQQIHLKLITAAESEYARRP